MLACFSKCAVKTPGDLIQNSLQSDPVVPSSAGYLSTIFCSTHPAAVVVNLPSSGFMAYSSDGQNPFLRRLFAVVDGIFCLFEGLIENVAHLKRHYGLNKTANEVIIVIEAYRTLRDRAPFSAEQVLRDIKGQFAFILFDNSTKATFIASDSGGSVPLFCGTDAGDHLVLSNDEEIVKLGCGKSTSPFPKGCFFTSSGGLRSY